MGIMRGTSCWVGLVLGIYLMVIAGFQYSFSSWSSDLKDLFGYTNAQTNTVGTFLNASSWAGVLGGIVLDRYGQRVTCLGAALISLIGFVPICLFMRQSNPSPSVAIICALMFVAGQG